VILGYSLIQSDPRLSAHPLVIPGSRAMLGYPLDIWLSPDPERSLVIQDIIGIKKRGERNSKHSDFRNISRYEDMTGMKKRGDRNSRA